jgi:hypothetical protein
VIVPVLGLAVALPLHYMGHFNYDWVSHLGPIYIGTIIYVVGAVVALIGHVTACLSLLIWEKQGEFWRNAGRRQASSS